MTPARPRSTANTVATIAAIIVFALIDVILAVLGGMVWSAHRRGTLTAAEAAGFSLLGASAAAGAVVLALTAVAVLRASSGHLLARVCAGLNWLRLGAVLLAIAAIAAAYGGPALIGLTETFAVVVTVAEVLGAILVTSLMVRRTRP